MVYVYGLANMLFIINSTKIVYRPAFPIILLISVKSFYSQKNIGCPICPSVEGGHHSSQDHLGTLKPPSMECL